MQRRPAHFLDRYPPRTARLSTALLRFLIVFLAFNASRALAQPAPSAEHRHAVLRFRGDLDAERTADKLLESVRSLAERGPRLLLIELTGDRARPDLLHRVVRAIRDTETPTAVYLADPGDRRVGPGMLAIALAAQHAAIAPRTTIDRTPADDLTHLNPDIEDWAVVNLDLRSVARDLAEAGPLDRLVYESALAPRGPLWIITDDQGAPALTDDEPAGGTRLADRTEDGWSFSIDAKGAQRLYRLGVQRSARAFERSLGLRGRPLEIIEIESGLTDAHERAHTLVLQIRTAIGLADAALDVRAGRAATTRLMPHEYHEAADKAGAYVGPCREAIAEIASLTDAYPEILRMEPPADEDTPTEIGGPSRTTLAAWRDAVRDAERDLARIDDRVESYRRR